MSKLYKLTSMIFALCLIITLVIPQEIIHATTTETENLTNLTIHKITGDTKETASYGELTGTETPDGEPISNIIFTYWEVSKAHYDVMMENQTAYQTTTQVETLTNTSGTALSATQDDGTTSIKGLTEGYYWFVENKSAAVIKSAAVPFGLVLPITNKNGNGYITNLHVYPKNTLAATPTIDETISGNNDKSKSADIGENITWNIKTTVPKGIEEYDKYTIESTIHDHLNFNVDNVSVDYNGTTLKKDIDYSISFNDGSRNLIIELPKTKFSEMGAAWNDSQNPPTLHISMTNRINNHAEMGNPIKNNSRILFDNGHGTNSSTSVEEPPVVYTGGKKFIKVTEDRDENGKLVTLPDAEFVILNSNGKFLKQDKETLDVSWAATQAEAKKFTSNTDGTFEVTGLSYGIDNDNNEGSSTYTLRETKAPTDYALPTNRNTEFIVNNSSYNDTQPIINKRVSIPDTGGTGTILFTVIGLALMILALVLIRRRKQA
ncbi:SpaH/EbpB family LPXTG-anchored major pilin [Salinicoccus hispanicus]|uniref:SpaH/EbpB family LPXTG-anchored major pilin n=1 Tax=Salinicoccus hispanicus TaxID=157225 RepID=A0A6N8U548_9STAP|nr:SpaH/EbpB family LPXTG-anchored major pilin [Salinicoccus hispanicus]MXQ51411.1 SpaH/EbpB family LPXTG-anchored major pilin [Salinicoccus hispanicus]